MFKYVNKFLINYFILTSIFFIIAFLAYLIVYFLQHKQPIVASLLAISAGGFVGALLETIKESK